jgi:ParB family chromosome partitioning protein
MIKGKSVLGRGLDALINSDRQQEDMPVERTAVASLPASFIMKIDIMLVDPNPFQPRTSFEPEAMEDLKKSIIANGLIQPITVRRFGDTRYQLISGERRLRACKDLGHKDIPAYILDVASDELMLAMALIENIQREHLNPIEIGLAYKRLMDECSLTQEEIAERVGKDRSTVANSIRLLKLPPQIQESLVKGDITMGHARALVNLVSVTKQLEILKKIVEENLSVRKVEQLVKNALVDKEQAGTNRAAKLSPKTAMDYSLQSIEDTLQRLLGTKVSIHRKKDGQGEIVIDFYSQVELERLLEMLHEIPQ